MLQSRRFELDLLHNDALWFIQMDFDFWIRGRLNVCLRIISVSRWHAQFIDNAKDYMLLSD